MSRVWTHFHDVHTGGRIKLHQFGDYVEDIYIEASEKEASIIFFNRFGINPEQTSCTCCGQDYSIWETDESEIDGIDEFGFSYSPFHSRGKKIVIKVYDIAPQEREGHLPVSGWVWHNG